MKTVCLTHVCILVTLFHKFNLPYFVFYQIKILSHLALVSTNTIGICLQLYISKQEQFKLMFKYINKQFSLFSLLFKFVCFFNKNYYYYYVKRYINFLLRVSNSLIYNKVLLIEAILCELFGSNSDIDIDENNPPLFEYLGPVEQHQTILNQSSGIRFFVNFTFFFFYK